MGKPRRSHAIHAALYINQFFINLVVKLTTFVGLGLVALYIPYASVLRLVLHESGGQCLPTSSRHRTLWEWPIGRQPLYYTFPSRVLGGGNPRDVS